MHEILFRGKCCVSNTWHIGNLVKLEDDSDDNNVEYRIVKADKSYFVVIPETVGQYTGLTDKNDTLIFEGDIIKAIWQHLGNTDTVIGIVKYDNAAFILETNDHYLFFEDNIFSFECEVIGNIHDNPELLNKGLIR